MEPTALLFDLDGTLVDSIPDIQGALNAMLAELGRSPLDAADVRAMVGDGAAAVVERALDATGGGRPGGALDRFLLLYAEAPCVHTRPYPGVVDTLDALARAGHRMALVTNKPVSHTRQVLQGLDLARFFPVVIGPETTGRRKPDPAPVIAGLVGLGVEPDAAIFVGDSPMDVAAARAAGLRVVAVSWGYGHGPAEALGADVLIARFDALPATIVALGGYANQA